MPQFEYESTSIHFEDHGSGFPVLLIAPGAMESAIEMWEGATLNPLALYADAFRLIAMDQRNAGRSFGPLEPSDPWGAYAKDQLALLNHLGIDRFHVMGACIGGSFALKLMEHAPTRVMAAVLEQPVGITAGNRLLYAQMWRSWGATGREIAALAPAGQVIEPWNDSQEHAHHAAEAVRSFLQAHSPRETA